MVCGSLKKFVTYAVINFRYQNYGNMKQQKEVKSFAVIDVENILTLKTSERW